MIFRLEPRSESRAPGYSRARQLPERLGPVSLGIFLIVTTAFSPASPLRVPAAQRAASAPDTTSVVMVSAGAGHTCAITSAGSTYCWGGNGAGQVGRARSVSEPVPHRVPVADLKMVAAGGAHTCGVAANGRAWCWGANEFGQLGNGSRAPSAVPVVVKGDLVFTSITSGAAHTCALTIDHQAYCWGDQWDRAAGSFDAGDNLTQPYAVQGDLRFTAISAGAHHTCAVSVEERVYCWGNNVDGEVGVLARRSRYFAPRLLDAGTRFEAVSAGRTHTCALTHGQVRCWGGRAGPSTASDGAKERSVTADRDGFIAISAGSAITCAIGSTDHRAHCWPVDEGGVQSDGVGKAESRRTRVAGDFRFAHITVGYGHACGITSAGALMCWGDNRIGQAGQLPSTAAVGPTVVALTDGL